MRKSTFVIFGVFVAFFAVAIPLMAIGDEGSPAVEVKASLEPAREAFQANCGACHTLKGGGTHGVVGPNLNELLAGVDKEAAESRVHNAILNGGSGTGAMPAGLLRGRAAREVSAFVAEAAVDE